MGPVCLNQFTDTYTKFVPECVVTPKANEKAILQATGDLHLHNRVTSEVVYEYS